MSLNFKENQNFGIASAVVASVILLLRPDQINHLLKLKERLHCALTNETKYKCVSCTKVKHKIYSSPLPGGWLLHHLYISWFQAKPKFGHSFRHRCFCDTGTSPHQWLFIPNYWNLHLHRQMKRSTISVLDVQKSNIQYKLTSPQRLIVASFVYPISLDLFYTKQIWFVIPPVVDCCFVVCMSLNCRHVQNFARGSTVIASVIQFWNNRYQTIIKSKLLHLHWQYKGGRSVLVEVWMVRKTH